MKLYGYTNTEPHKLAELKEVSFVADPAELRKLAEFLIDQAERHAEEDEQEHAHFSDFVRDREMSVDVIVCNQKYFRELQESISD
jgi:hypothetical protein